MIETLKKVRVSILPDKYYRISKEILARYFPGLSASVRNHLDNMAPINAKNKGNWFIPEKKHEECIIIANGPSVKTHYEELIRFTMDKDVFTVNFSITSDLANNINLYMHTIADPLFFAPHHGTIKYRNSIDKFYAKLNSINENIILAVPHMFYSFMLEKISNRNIAILTFPSHVAKEITAKSEHSLREGLVCFGGQTVPLFSLYIALMAQYRKIYIIGLDLSYKIIVDNFCHVVSDDMHYYDKESCPDTYENLYFKDILKGYIEIHESLLLAKKYADSHDIKIVNLSLESQIDIFPKGTFDGTIFPFKPSLAPMGHDTQ